MMSDITIFSVPLSHHNSEIRCETTFAPFETSRITVAGACTTITCMHMHSSYVFISLYIQVQLVLHLI